MRYSQDEADSLVTRLNGNGFFYSEEAPFLARL
jgi:hypothetical protein